ncbi:MAG: FtsX-like permease family protein, partial [Bacteroidota bacterium]
NEIASIKEYTRIASSTLTLSVNNNYFEESIHFVDKGFFKMFDFPLLKVHEKGITQPNTIIISEEKAIKLFGNENALDKVLSLKINGQTQLVKVVGVINPKKEQSSIQFDFLAPLDLFRIEIGEQAFNSFDYGIVENYILSNTAKSKEEIELLCTQAVQKYSNEERYKKTIGLQALNNIHLNDTIIGNATYTSAQKLYVMSTLAFVVLLISILNFITLSTNHALNRAKELGIRSSLGALKGNLRQQLINESFFVALFSSMIGITIAYLVMPYFSHLVESNVVFVFGPRELLFIVVISIIIALVNGSLQSYFLIKKKIITTLKQNIIISNKNSLFNQYLLIVQFSLAILLIIGALSIRMQMQYIQNKDLGYEKSRLIEMNINTSENIEGTRKLVERFKTKAFQNKHILAVSASMNNTREPWTKLAFEQENGQSEQLFYNQIDPEYLKTLQIELLDGEGFKRDYTKYKNAIIVNEALVRHFGWEQAMGKQIPGKNFKEAHQIIGVVKDFHFSSLHQQIAPLILAVDLEAIESGITGLNTYIWPANMYQILVRIAPADLPPVIQSLAEIWKEVAPDKPFVYHFVDDVLEKKYANEQRWAKVMNVASIFAIVIACIGLLGLMQLSVQRKTKEIGIRKVLGSSIVNLLVLFSKGYIKLITIAFVISIPIANYFISEWLQAFAYRIDVKWWLFALPGITVFTLALIALGGQSIKAALANPIESLRSE